MERLATYDDVNLILRLYELRRDEKLRKAREWFMASCHARTMQELQELCPQGSEENAYLRMVISYWDMAASFVTSGVLNEELFFQSGGELLFVWERIRDTVPEMRTTFKNPYNLKNMEEVAASFIKWQNERAPEWYQGFREMVRAGANPAQQKTTAG